MTSSWQLFKNFNLSKWHDTHFYRFFVLCSFSVHPGWEWKKCERETGIVQPMVLTPEMLTAKSLCHFLGSGQLCEGITESFSLHRIKLVLCLKIDILCFPIIMEIKLAKVITTKQVNSNMYWRHCGKHFFRISFCVWDEFLETKTC